MSSAVELPPLFGRYRIERKLGQGGMGTVYLALDTRLQRWVALKVPHFTAEDGPSVIQRFEREARLAAQIEHPHLCPVYDVGEIDGLHYFTMPFIEGLPLSRYIGPDRPCPPRQATELIGKVALALAELHARGIIHRDLKPGNIMIRKNGEPVLMDFGLARSFTGQTRKLTTTTAPVGTPAYMSPEQINGARNLGPSTDIYSLGVILFEVLTGRLPFEGPMMAVFAQILHADPPPPSSLVPALDADIDAVCLRALAKNPAERYPDMNALASTLLHHARTGQVLPVTVPAGPAWTPAGGVPAEPTPRPSATRQDAATADGARSSTVPSTPTLVPAAGPSRALIAAIVFLGLCILAAGGIVWYVTQKQPQSPVVVQQTVPVTRPSNEEPVKIRPTKLVAAGPAKLTLLPPERLTITAGQKKTVTLNIERTNCPEPVRLRSVTVSPGLRVLPGTIAANALQGSVEVIVEESASPGRRKLTLLAEAGDLSHSEELELLIEPAATLTLNTPKPVSLAVGQTLRVPVAIQRQNCPGRVEIRVTPTAGLSAPTAIIDEGEHGLLVLTAGREAEAGTHRLRLTARAGNLVSQATLEVEVRKLEAGSLTTTSTGMTLAYVPPGSFRMGSPEGEEDRFPDEGPRHDVNLTRGFFMGTREVTIGQFKQFVADSDYRTEAERAGLETTWKNALPDAGDDHPVVMVSWNDALEFCKWLSKKEKKTFDLPTEAEWEYACRAGTSWAYCYGDDPRKLGEYGWFWDDSGRKAQKVGQKKPNRWGLHDMHGNVWEWCKDGPREYKNEEVTDPTGESSSRRALRGGSSSFNARYCRSAVRLDFDASSRDTDVGFRVVLRP